jgi:hypothetical protein
MARLFDGVDDYIVSSSSLDLSGTNKITIVFWAKWTSFSTNDDIIAEFSTNFSTNVGSFFIDPNSSGFDGTKFRVVLNGNVGLSDVGFARPSAGVWHHYAIRFDMSKSTNEVDAIYVDNTLQTLTTSTNSNNTGNFGNYVLYLMSRGGTTLFGDGTLAEFAIYDALLTTAEISALSKGVTPNNIRRNNLKFYLPLWAVASPEADLSGGRNNGTVTGAVLANHAPVGRYVPQRI